MSKINQKPVTIKLPGEEYPYMNCIIEQGSIANLGDETLVFTTVSKAGNTRRITRHPNGAQQEESIEQEEA